MNHSIIFTIEGNTDNKLYLDRVDNLDKLMAFLYAFNSRWLVAMAKENAGNQVFANFRSGSKKLVGLIQSAAFHELISDGLEPIDQVPLYGNSYGWDILPYSYTDDISLKIKIHLNGMVYLTRPKPIVF